MYCCCDTTEIPIPQSLLDRCFPPKTAPDPVGIHQGIIEEIRHAEGKRRLSADLAETRREMPAIREET
jgi:hypothetical protein